MKRTLIVFLTLIIALSFTSCGYMAVSTAYYNETKDYDSVWELAGVTESEASVFPESVEGLETEEFFCRYDECLPLGEGVQILLRVKYDDSDFENEIKRLKEIASDDHDDLFEYSAFVSRLGEEYSFYEYALSDGEQKEIVYVYINGLPKSEIEIDGKYLPSNYEDYGRE